MRDWLLLQGFRLLPAPLARHALFLLRSHSALADTWGYHIRPIHYYDPLPDFRELTAEQLATRRVPPTTDFNLSAQCQLVGTLAAAYRDELDALASTPEPGGFDFSNSYFSGLDAALYYSLIRHLRPKRVIEIGSGYSTRIADKALQRNIAQGCPGRMTCIEPFPEPRLTDASLPSVTLVQERVESVPLSVFAELGPGDVLFIDSSHVVKCGSDVFREFLDILPSLAAGVWVHVHDIFFPHDYPREWLLEKRIAFNEQYLLEAFLAFNDRFSVRASNHWLACEEPGTVALLGTCTGQVRQGAGAASFWMRKES